jgi:tetraacyldisaccharide 4'-kinase
VVAARNALYDRQILEARKLAWPVVSVGNISVGGSGKTPFVIMLGEWLAARGIWFDVLSRGYRRSTEGVRFVQERGSSLEFGDEPLLIARTLGCPVIVGESRYEAGLAAERAYAAATPNPMHLLDDGFQHRRLYRDFDIVLLSREDLDDKLLPSGRLREPITALSRADAIAVENGFPLERLPRGNFAVWQVRRELQLRSIAGPVVAFCGIARPQRFFADLRKLGVEIRHEIVFGDHHRYSANDAERLHTAISRFAGAKLVTTEKDAINLGPHLAALNPLVISVRMKLADSDQALNHMLGTIAERRRCR